MPRSAYTFRFRKSQQVGTKPLSRFALWISAAALLAGCGGSQSPIATPGSMQQSAAITTRAAHGASWMLPEAKSEDLLYASNDKAYSGFGDVLVFSYPEGQLVGTLTKGIDEPAGLCVDKSGDIWIVNFGPSEIVEYAHGGTSPIATLSDPDSGLNGCSADASTGNLAVTDLSGKVAIYQNAKGTPTMYSDPNIAGLYYCTYDTNGDLFVDGTSADLIGELRKGDSTFTDIMLNKSIGPDSIQWRGPHLTVEAAAGQNSHGPTAIDQVTISGNSGMVIRTTLLSSRHNRRTVSGSSVLDTRWHDYRTRLLSWRR
jgi:hypothetical protein